MTVRKVRVKLPADLGGAVIEAMHSEPEFGIMPYHVYRWKRDGLDQAFRSNQALEEAPELPKPTIVLRDITILSLTVGHNGTSMVIRDNETDTVIDMPGGPIKINQECPNCGWMWPVEEHSKTKE